eukprot:TRINITY_DN33215_c0_g1_i1.p1 TRINITY_DN33215_c0_g1~~TRINITY_DN33215_c0_g1_i1.p1  ORF type:complete len:655 (+),score=48.12 TRINITY_DN33215_c0_g1_i1:65-2029(+)
MGGTDVTLKPLDYAIVILYFVILFTVSSFSTVLKLVKRCQRKQVASTPRPNEQEMTEIVPSKQEAEDEEKEEGEQSNEETAEPPSQTLQIPDYRETQQDEEQENPADYFLNSGGTAWWAVACTYFASNIGSDAIVGTAGAASYTGAPVALFDWLSAVLCFPLLTFFILPTFLKSKIFTMPEFIQLRIGPLSRLYLAGIHLFRFTAWIGGMLYSGQVVCETLLGWNKYLATACLVILTGAYTSVGGLRAVVITEVMQTVLILGGTITALVLSLNAVGGWTTLREELPPFWFQVYQTGEKFELPSYPFPWWSMTFGLPILAINYHCYDQEMTQRGLSAKNLKHGTLGTITAAYLKYLPPLLYVFPGMIARVLDNTKGWNELGCARPDYYVGDCEHKDKAFILLVKHILPTGVKGVMLACILAAMMSSLAALFNSSSTIVTMDIYTKIKGIDPRTAHKDKSLVWVGRISAAGACLVGVAWVPVLKLLHHGLLDFVQEIASVSAPPMMVLFTAALLLPPGRISDLSAVATLGIGHAVAIFMVIMRATAVLPGALNWFVQDYMFACTFTFCISVIVLLICLVTVSKEPEYPKPQQGAADGAGETIATNLLAGEEEENEQFDVLGMWNTALAEKDKFAIATVVLAVGVVGIYAFICITLR